MANWEKLNKEFDDAITQFDKWDKICNLFEIENEYEKILSKVKRIQFTRFH